MEKEVKREFFNIQDLIDKYPSATYYLVIGGRSVGKSYSAFGRAIYERLKYGTVTPLIRRNQEDILSAKLLTILNNHIIEGSYYFNMLVTEYFDLYDETQTMSCNYRGGFLNIVTRDLKGKIVQSLDVMYPCSLSNWERYKGVTLQKVRTIIYDEYLSRERYLVDEFSCLTNMISTLARTNTPKIIMLANTVSMINPYDLPMGIKHSDLEIGTTKVYVDDTNNPYIILHRCKSYDVGNRKLFKFADNGVRMISQGDWEVDEYDISELITKECFYTIHLFHEGFFNVYLNLCLNENGYYGHVTKDEILKSYVTISPVSYNFEMNCYSSIKYIKNVKIRGVIADIINNNRFKVDSLESGEQFRHFIKNS